MTSWRGVLILLLWIGFRVVGVAMVGALAWIPVAQVHYSSLDAGGMIAAGLAITVAWALRPRLSLGKQGPKPDPLARGQFPELFRFLEDVAQRVGAAVPRKIYLTLEANAFAGTEHRWLGLRSEPFVGVGLPLFAVLTREELGAVITHEYGHHLGGDVALGPWVHRTRVAVASAVDSLEDSAFSLDVPFSAYGRLFLRVSRTVSRQQELAADALSARVWGSAHAGGALRKVERTARLWEAYAFADLLPLIGRGLRMPMLEGFRLFEAVRRREVEATVPGEPPCPSDTHPPLEERLRSIGAPVRATCLEGGGCLDLLGGEEAAEAAWYAQSVTGDLRLASWDDVGTRVLLPEIRAELEGGILDPARTRLGDPRLLANGEEVWPRIRGPGIDLLSPEARRREMRGVLARWLAASLAAYGFEPVIRPGAPLTLRRGEAEPVEPQAIVERLATGALGEVEFRAWVAECEARGDDHDVGASRPLA